VKDPRYPERDRQATPRTDRDLLVKKSSGILRIKRNIGATSEFGDHRVTLTPGASSTCNGTACCCCSCW
jgi:hypothetical protein